MSQAHAEASRQEEEELAGGGSEEWGLGLGVCWGRTGMKRVFGGSCLGISFTAEGNESHVMSGPDSL